MTCSGLNSPVLVLNRNYMAIHMVTCRRALCLLFKNYAEVIHEEEGTFNSIGFDRWIEHSARRYAVASSSDRQRGALLDIPAATATHGVNGSHSANGASLRRRKKSKARNSRAEHNGTQREAGCTPGGIDPELTDPPGVEPGADQDWILSVSCPVEVPRIIRLLNFDRFLKQLVPLTRKHVFARDNYLCQYCGAGRPHATLTIDHVQPRSRGGRESWDNVVTACSRCNHKKGHKPLSQSGLKLMTRPRAPVINPVLELNLSDRRFASWKRFVRL